MDGCEEVIVAFVVSGCNGAEVFEFAEEAFDEVAIFVEKVAEGGLNNGRYILDHINRRDIADDLRAIPSLSVPSNEELDSFDAFMKGPLD